MLVAGEVGGGFAFVALERPPSGGRAFAPLTIDAAGGWSLGAPLLTTASPNPRNTEALVVDDTLHFFWLSGQSEVTLGHFAARW